MADKRMIRNLALAAGRELDKGRPGDDAAMATEVVQADPATTLDIVQLIAEEPTTDQPSPSVSQGLAYLFARGLEAIRYGIESDRSESRAMLERVRAAVLEVGRSDHVDADSLLAILAGFGQAELDPGPELRELLSGLLDDAGASAPPAGTGDMTAAMDQLSTQIGEVAEALGGDPFALFSQLEELAGAFGDDFGRVMPGFLLQADHPAAREAAMGWLLDDKPAFRAQVASALENAAAAGRVSPVMLRRLITMRSWVAEDTRPALDRAVQACRREGVACAAWPRAAKPTIRATGVDGSGAAGVLARRGEKRRHTLGSLLGRCGHGLRDAWVAHELKKSEVDASFSDALAVDAIAVDSATLREITGHFLGLSLETGAKVPFGLVDFAETMGLAELRPERRSNEALIEAVEQEGVSGEPDAAADPEALLERHVFLTSWFEEGDAVAETLGRDDLNPEEKERWLLETHLEGRRQRWTEMASLAAFILARAQEEAAARRSSDLHGAARALLDGRPMAAIPLMRLVAAQTLEAQGVV